nr:TIGR00269 family protein [Methanothermus fervidus]
MKKIRRVVKNYKLIENGDVISVALSGGKDSLLTLYALKNLQNEINFKLNAIFIDEGIKNYRKNALKYLRKHVKKLEVELIKKSFKEEFGFKVDEIKDYFDTPCIPCGIFRRYLLNKTAYEVGASKLATGHNLDDEIQSFLMSLVRGDTFRFYKFGPKLDRIHPKLIPRIKPLWEVSEKEVIDWVVKNDIEVQMERCPYSKYSFRFKLMNFLNEIEKIEPGTKENIMKSFKKTFLSLKKKDVKVVECKECFWPSSNELCKVCELKKYLRNITQQF